MHISLSKVAHFIIVTNFYSHLQFWGSVTGDCGYTGAGVDRQVKRPPWLLKKRIC